MLDICIIVLGVALVGVNIWFRLAFRKYEKLCPPPDTYSGLRDRLRAIAAVEGGKMWFNRPERWYDTPKWRCTAGHVSGHYIKGDNGLDRCPACGCRVALTFPEDRDGPLRPSPVGLGRNDPAYQHVGNRPS